MRKTLLGLGYGVAAISTLALLLTAGSLVPSSEWWIQILGFPREQLFVGHALTLLVLLPLAWRQHRRARLALLLGSALGLLVQSWYLRPYTALASPQVAEASPALARDSAAQLSILISNVYMKNRQYGRLLALVRATRPDVLLAMETDAAWVQALQPLHPRYPYRLELPRDDTYGLVLYSRLPLDSVRSQNLQQQGVPSVRTHIRLPDGRRLVFHGVHPTPPIPDNYPDGANQHSVVLTKIAAMIRQEPEPAIVAGDFNDVSWSSTNRRLARQSGAQDVSLGRGFYNSFNTHMPLLMRWPLDHFFVTPQLRVVSLERLPSIGSDHFPLLARLALSRE